MPHTQETRRGGRAEGKRLPPHSSPIPTADETRRAEAERFLMALDEEAETFCFQTFDDSGKRGDLARTLHGTLAVLWPRLEALNIAGAGVFVTVNEVPPSAPRTAANVCRVRACFADFDPPKTAAPPATYPLAPVLEVESSPGKRHAYWTVDGLERDAFEAQQRGIIAALGSDPAPIDLPRVMRLPGFRHMKEPARPALVRIVSTDERIPYKPEDLQRAFPPAARKAGGERPDLGGDPIAQALNTRGLILKPKADGGWFITCPWENEHTTPSTPTATVYYPPHTGGYAGAAFKCQHGHCQDRTAADLRQWLDLRPGSGEKSPDPEPLPARGDIGEAASFPLDLLPPALRTATTEVARFTKVDPAAPALVGLAALGVAIGKRALVVEREGLTHHPALFFVGIAGSGERKSPVFRAMTQALEDWTESQVPAWEEAKRKASARNAAVDAAISKAKSTAKKSGDIHESAREIADLEAERLPSPPYPRLFTSDATEQRLFQLMHDRGGAFAVLSGEGRPVFDAIMGKYSGDGRTGDALYLAGISGDTITRDRVGGEGGPEERVIRQPCLTVCIMVQPDKYLEAATHPALQASGAVGRIWPVWLPVMVGKQHEGEDEPGLSSELLAPYNALLWRLLEHDPPEDRDGCPRPHLARLSPEAAKARRIFHNAVQDTMADGGDLEDCRKVAAKAVSQTVKLALCLHFAGNPDALIDPGSVITRQTWARAQALGTWFLTEAVRVQRLAEEDPTLEAARRVLGWLEREPRETLNGRTLQQHGPRPRPKAREAGAVLDLLADHGYLREETPPGARKPVYRLHPAVCSQSSRCSRG